MNKNLLFYVESLNTLKARRWALSQQEEQKAREIQALIIQQAELDDQIFLWEKEIDKLRNLEKAVRVGLIFLALLTGCSKDSRPQPGAFLPSYPCTRCADGTLYCSDLVKPSC